MSIFIHEVYQFHGKMYVNTKFLCAYFNKDAKTISRWKKDGLPIAEQPKELKVRGDLYHLDEVIKWVDENINKTKSRASSKKTKSVDLQDNDEDIELVDIDTKIKEIKQEIGSTNVKKLPQDEMSTLIGNMEKLTKLEITRGDLIHKRDTEKVVLEFAATLISGYKRDIKILPAECENRDKETIRNILEKTYRSNIEKYQKLARSDMVSESKLYDIMEVVYQLIVDGVQIDEILKRIIG